MSNDGGRKQKQIVKLEGWDEEFMSTIYYINEQGQSILFDIIIAANYLHIQGLINITTMEVARKLENKTPEQIRELFKLENDLEINDDETKDDDTMETNKRCEIWISNLSSLGKLKIISEIIIHMCNILIFMLLMFLVLVS